MISFRVSEREFEQLKNKSEAEGARSISDFARLALCGSNGSSSERVDEGINRSERRRSAVERRCSTGYRADRGVRVHAEPSSYLFDGEKEQRSLT